MILGSSEIFRRIIHDNMITNLPDEFIIEGVTVDVRVDKVFKHLGGATLLESKRNTGEVVEFAHSKLDDLDSVWVLQPGQTYLVQTVENLNMPNDVVGYVSERSTVFRSNLLLMATYVNPGYEGALTFGLHNTSDKPVVMERGFRVAQIGFHNIVGSCTMYSGNWQGGKAHTYNDFDPAR